MPGLVQQTQQDRPVADIEELHKELRVSARRNRDRGMTLRDSKEDVRKSKEIIRELLHSVSESNVVALCTCQQSKDFPFCDNTHAVFNKATNSNMAPLYVAIVDRTCGECGSKRTEHGACCSADNIRSSTDSTSSDCNNTEAPSQPTTKTRKSSSRSLRKSTDKQLTTATTTTCRCKDTTSHHSLTHSNSSNTIHTPSTPSDNTPTYTTPAEITPPTTNTATPTTPTDNKPTDTTSSSDNVIIPNRNCITKEEDKDQEKNNDEKTDATINSPIYKPSSIKDPINQKNVISKAVVSVHNTREDLWMIIKGNVYDITDYVQYHPGGVRALVKFAGKDGTENVQYHSSKMLEILNNNYFIGKLPKEEGGGGGCTIC